MIDGARVSVMTRSFPCELPCRNLQARLQRRKMKKFVNQQAESFQTHANHFHLSNVACNNDNGLSYESHCGVNLSK